MGRRGPTSKVGVDVMVIVTDDTGERHTVDPQDYSYAWATGGIMVIEFENGDWIACTDKEFYRFLQARKAAMQ